MVEKKEDEFYVGLQNPVETRRNVLESSKFIIKVLQKFDSIKHVREQKEEQLAKVRALTGEVHDLSARLKTLLPNIALEKLPKPATPKKTTTSSKKKVMPKPAAPKPRTEMDKLQEQLDMIDNKLREL